MSTPGSPSSPRARRWLESPAIVAALLTPFGRDGEIDLEALGAHVRWLVDEGIDGVMPCGTTGECALLEEDEVLAIVGASVEAAAGRVPVLAHVGRPSTRATVRLAEQAMEAGAAAISAVVPYYYALDQGQIVRHYRSLVDALAGTPVLAYNIPSQTGNDLSASSVRELAGHGLAGLKDSTKSLDRQLEYLDASRDVDGFAVMVGSASLVSESLRAGGSGAVLALANLRPDLCVALKRAFLGGRTEEAARLQAEMTELEREVTPGAPLVGLKRAVAAAMATRGVSYSAALRAPLGSGGAARESPAERSFAAAAPGE